MLVNENFGAIGPNLKILYNSILIVDKENALTYLGWLGISGVISKKPQILIVTGFFRFVNAR